MKRYSSPKRVQRGLIFVTFVGLVAHLQDHKCSRLVHKPKRELESIQLVLQVEAVYVVKNDDQGVLSNPQDVVRNPLRHLTVVILPLRKVCGF